MTRRPIVAGNWKMHNDLAQSVALVDALCKSLAHVTGVDVVLCPPFIALAAAAERLRGSALALGAQNVHWSDTGAYTGEISPLMLKGLVQYVIVGHSERRAYFCESDDSVNKKVHAALQHGLTPIVCVGENEREHEAGDTSAVVGAQVHAALRGVSASRAAHIVMAYEPVWAIGTGKSASPAGANAVIGLTIRGVLSDLFGAVAAESVRVQYGGSVTAHNMAQFMQQPDIDGALVGGASLKADDFAHIVEAAA